MKRSKPPFFELFYSRSGMELAINTLVVIILGIIIVTGGIYLLSVIMSGSNELPSKITADQQNELNSMMTKGQLVAVSPLSKESPGAKPVSFAVGIDNRLDYGANFTISIIPIANWSTTYNSLLYVPQNAKSTSLIIVGAKAGKTVPKGTYTFIVTANYTDAGASVVYDSPRYFTVVVS